MTTRRRFLMQSAATLAAARSSISIAETAPVLIDSHVHVFARNPQFPFAQGAKPPAQDAPPEMLLSLMRANGVSRTVLIQVIHYKWDNSYLANVLQRYPREFQGVCRVNPQDPAAPDHLSALTAQGFRGVRISSAATAEGDWIRGPLMPPLWRRCNELGVPMTVLVPITRVPDLVPLIEANPNLTVVIDHMADCPLDRPDQLKFLLDLARYPKVFVKLSDMWALSHQPYPYPDAQDQVKRLLQAFGSSRLMWDTNWPVSLAQLPYAKIVELYRDHLPFLNRSEREDILSKTVQHIWPFGL
jgi:L-fuconolactonase